MKKIIITFVILLFFISGHQASGVKPNVADDLLYFPPLVSHGLWAGVPFGYGYFNYKVWPLASIFGFTYLPYHQNRPYYSRFGAVAYSVHTKNVGLAWNHNTLNEAVAQALSFCGVGDCRPVVWVQGGCAALAVNRVSTRIGWSYADSQLRATTGALRACHSGENGSARCNIEAWICSF